MGDSRFCVDLGFRSRRRKSMEICSIGNRQPLTPGAPLLLHSLVLLLRCTIAADSQVIIGSITSVNASSSVAATSTSSFVGSTTISSSSMDTFATSTSTTATASILSPSASFIIAASPSAAAAAEKADETSTEFLAPKRRRGFLGGRKTRTEGNGKYRRRLQIRRRQNRS